MSEIDATKYRELLIQRAELWRRADSELKAIQREAIQRKDLGGVTAREAIRQIFDGMESALIAPGASTSGLVEQQMWFSRIRAAGKVEPPRLDR